MRTIKNTLDVWVSELLTAQDVTEWAVREIVRLDAPPAELIDLAIDGQEACFKRALGDFPLRATKLRYVDEFAVRAVTLVLSAADSVRTFADWASRCFEASKRISRTVLQRGRNSTSRADGYH